MLFNKKLIMGLCNILGLMLIINILVYITMYIWAFFGTPPLPFFDISQGVISYYTFIFKLLTLVFYYVVVAGFAALVKSSKLREGFKK